MNQLCDCELLARYETTLCETSLGGTPAKPMTDSTENAINIDDVMREYADSMPNKDGRPPSVDALARYASNSPVLIEFKSGKDTKQESIRPKLLSTLLMLAEVTGMHINDFRNHVSFFLVCDRTVLCGAGNNNGDASSVVQSSVSRGKLTDAIQRKANVSWVPNRLSKLGNGMEGIFVKSFKVIDKDDLDSSLTQLGL